MIVAFPFLGPREAEKHPNRKQHNELVFVSHFVPFNGSYLLTFGERIQRILKDSSGGLHGDLIPAQG